LHLSSFSGSILLIEKRGEGEGLDRGLERGRLIFTNPSSEKLVTRTERAESTIFEFVTFGHAAPQ